ncbi:hypothetical protein HPB48_019306 [Haemaphysalis longicornis]|uniref:Uncharacterized protein n=1 Tax=Haemaphysalis longicornis TaxID=44386 RepID=A0A9J6F9G3_HAELO|nr:hypothetical protein HPB48_019306 [Haemaphysalis longicornis]
MEVVEVDKEPISPEDYENDAGWITSHQQRSSRAKARLTDRDSRNQEGAHREQAHKIQNQLGVRRPRLPPLPREDIKIPRDGLNTSRVSYAQLRDGVLRAAAVSTERAREDIFSPSPRTEHHGREYANDGKCQEVLQHQRNSSREPDLCYDGVCDAPGRHIERRDSQYTQL